MKKALNAWAVDPALDFESTFAAVSAAGFDGIELNFDPPDKSAHSLTVESTDDDYRRIISLSEKYSLPVVSVSSSLGWKHHIGVVADRDTATKDFEAQLLAAVKLGAKGILTLPDGVNENGSWLRAYENSIEFYESERTFIEDCGLTVGVENVWNGFFTSANDVLKFINDCNNPYIKAYFDVGNVFAFSSPEHWAELLGNNIGFVHVKGYKRNKGLNSGGSFCAVLDGGIDWNAVMTQIKNAGFDTYITAEVGRASCPELSFEEFYAKTRRDLETLISYI